VNQRVDQRLADGDQRNGPPFVMTGRLDFDGDGLMLAQKADGSIRQGRKRSIKIRRVVNACPIGSTEASGLKVGVREQAQPVLAEQQDAADCRD
jgi:hypothetical protein